MASERGPSGARLVAIDERGDRQFSLILPPRTTGPVRLACYAFDVLLAGSPPTGISARNVVPARVSALVPAGESVLVELGSLPLRAMLTQGAVRAMELAPGAPVVAIVKATSIAYLGPA